MTPTVILVSIIILPVILCLLLRSNAAIMFLSLCAGYVLSQFVLDDAKFVASLTIKSDATTTLITKAFLIGLPVVLSLFVLRGTVGKSKQFMQLLPAVLTGALLLFIVTPLLSAQLQTQVASSMLWKPINQLESILISLGVFVSLVMTWSALRKNHKLQTHHKKHK